MLDCAEMLDPTRLSEVFLPMTLGIASALVIAAFGMAGGATYARYIER